MKRVEVNPRISDLHPRFHVVEGSAPAFSSALELEPGYPEQVIGGHGEEELSTHADRSSEPCLAHPRHRLGPSEDLFDALPLPLTQLVSAATRRASIDRRTIASAASDSARPSACDTRASVHNPLRFSIRT